MAVKWAIADGNYNAGTTWNDGIAPRDGDIVYMNGHTITLNFTPNLPNTIIRNDECPDTGLSGGHMTFNPVYGNINWVFKKLISHNETLIVTSVTANYPNFTITSDIEAVGGFAIETQTGGSAVVNLRINGNVSGNHSIIQGNNKTFQTITLTGNLENIATNLCYLVEVNTTAKYTTLIHNGNSVGFNYLTNGGTTATINGNVTLNSTEYTESLSLSGNLTANNASFWGKDASFNGIINYNGGCVGLSYVNLQIQNYNSFRWVDISAERSNPFIILTNYDLNNTEQYPIESDVKNGVPYAYGQKTGTLTPVSNTNTINVYPYKKWH